MSQTLSKNEFSDKLREIAIELSAAIYELELKCLELNDESIREVFSRHGFKAAERVYITGPTTWLIWGAIIEFQKYPKGHSEKEKQELVDLLTSVSNLMRKAMELAREENSELRPKKYYDETASYLAERAKELSQIKLPTVGKNNIVPGKK